MNAISSKVLGEFESVTKQFGSTQALRGLSFKIYPGINGLIGPNGAGKTTTIRLSLGLIKPDTGNADMFGLNCWKESLEIRRRIGILYEKSAFYDSLSGFDQLSLIAKLKGISNPSIEIKRVLRLVELERDAQSRKTGGYSAGMRQRLGFAQALLGEPELVILDEPTSNLDPLGRTKLLNVIKDLSKNGVSFLISSHILPELERVCDNFVLMNKGQKIREGTIEQMLGEKTSKTFVVNVQPADSLLKLLEREKYVETLSMNGVSLYVTVNDVKYFKQRLPLLISQAHASLDEVKVLKEDLESVFKSVIEEDSDEKISES
ncbi:MAG: ABC transporter ATP-binding protein [Candidatus Bathyarchaeota archaeon]|nr:MAG: ABC transporter ATP-binding protein [Candidatus Bathyarchaeota archaeon]